MKNLKLIVLSLGLVCTMFSLQAQTYAEGALLFSRTNPNGTARIQALGGAQISLGGDVSLAGSNPAGLGMSNRSSFTITGGLLSNNTESSFYNTLTPDSKVNLNIPQIGVIIHKGSRSESKFKGGALAVNFNRINTYHNNVTYTADPGDNSIIDYFFNEVGLEVGVDGVPLSDFDEGGYHYNTPTGLGWYTYLIDTATVLDGNGQEFTIYDSVVEGFPNSQTEQIETRGSHYQWNFSYGANYDDILFFGAGLGLTNFRYNSQKRLTETFDGVSVSSIDLEENLFIDGSGINFTLGMIARPIRFLQVGVSYTTPTLYNVNDQWDASILTDWNNYTYPTTGEVLGQISEQTEILISDYSLTAPARFSIGATGFLGKYGFVTADFEQVDYSKTRLTSRDFSMNIDNQEINSQFVKATTVRGGLELRYEILRFRLGAGLTTSPFNGDDPSTDNFDRSIKTVSGGLGIRNNNFFADFAVVRSTTDAINRPYYLDGTDNTAISSIKNVRGLLTVGFNF